MARLNRTDFLAKLQKLVGEDTSDEALQLLEDFIDTYDELEASSNGDGEDWKKKFEENDKEWRTRYKERFYSGSTKEDKLEDIQEDEEGDEEQEVTIDDLFKEVE